MSIAVERKIAEPRTSFLASPLAVLAAAFALVLVLLSLPLSVPIGPMSGRSATTCSQAGWRSFQTASRP